MMQSKYPPAELRYGENLVAIEDFNFHKDDADAGNPYNTTFGIRVVSRAFQGYASCDCSAQQFCDFVKQLQEMYEFRCFNATLSAMYYGSSVSLALDKKGHIKVEGKIFDDGMEQCLIFTFTTDQSALPPFIDGLKNMIS